MDPLSQAAFGAAFSGAAAPTKRLLPAVFAGAAAGMAPDLDILIRSSEDPLLALEYHRQFTHSLVFIPFGALLCGVLMYPLFRRWLSPKALYLSSLLGYGSHGVLDACTSYGTLLFWPFSQARIAWHTISIIDPLFTFPLVFFLIGAIMHQHPRWARVAVAWALMYLGLGAIQHSRVQSAAEALIRERGHTPTKHEVRPSFGNLLGWRSIYQSENSYHVDAIRAGMTMNVCPGAHGPAFEVSRDAPWLSASPTQAEDLERFRWFSSDFLMPLPNNRVGDARYAMLPTQLAPLFQIRFFPGEARHVAYGAEQKLDATDIDAFFDFLLDGQCPKTSPPTNLRAGTGPNACDTHCSAKKNTAPRPNNGAE